jgi:RHS repeat-associated protein
VADNGWFNISGITNNRMNGMTYDAAGNLTQMSPNTAEYDAENRLKTVRQGAAVQASYEYDGHGRRVKRTVGTATTYYVYDASGQLMAEYGGTTAGAGGTQYLVADHLGSTRLVLDGQGNCVQRLDYLPFGMEMPRTEPCYGGNPAVNVSGVAQQFTGKERDPETVNSANPSGLDFFGARYLASAQRRFTSPDAPLLDQHPEGPQSWNLYSYVRNNSLVNIDPTGNDCVYVNSAGDGVESINNQNTSKDCGKTDGYWVDGTVTNARFAHGSLILTGTTDGRNRTSASYGLGPDPGLLALQRGTQLAAPSVNAAGTVLAVGAVVTTVAVAGPTIASGTALNQLAIATLPALPTAADKLQKIGLSIYEAGKIVASPTAQRLIDTANGGNVNVIQQVGDKLVRITLDPSGQRIISAGYIQSRNVANSIASGRFIPK